MASFRSRRGQVQFLRRVFRPAVADAAGLRLYVVSVTLFAWAIALSADVANQLIFFTNWTDCWREWSVTTIVVLAIAWPVARAMGRAQLELFTAHAPKPSG